MYCVACGAAIVDEWRFCKSCGNPVEPVDAARPVERVHVSRKGGLAGFVRSERPIWQRAAVVLFLFLFWISSEIRQTSWAPALRWGMIAAVWLPVAASAMTSEPSEQPRAVQEVAPTIAAPDVAPTPSPSAIVEPPAPTEEPSYLAAPPKKSAESDTTSESYSESRARGFSGNSGGGDGPVESEEYQPEFEPAPEPEPEPEPAGEKCHPNYSGACLKPDSPDYDCAGGSGNGPDYVDGPVYVQGDDTYDLDRDGNGVGCED
jgi:hypothetical protein